MTRDQRKTFNGTVEAGSRPADVYVLRETVSLSVELATR
jgi:hypothetical protein